MTRIILSIIISFLVCVTLAPILIPFLRRLKFGQQILEIGPNWHKNKAGTPTMGGLSFIVAITVAAIAIPSDGKTWMVLGFALLCGAIGFADDYIKVCLKRNMGFNAAQKTLCLVLIMVLFVGLSFYFKFLDTSVYLPFAHGYVDFGLWYYPFILVVIFGGINSVNLTDGIDGLAGSVTALVMIYFTITAFLNQFIGLSILSAAVLGGLIGFLIFNLYPARMFMGDTGSLFLGGMVCALAVMMKNPIILIVVGLVYVLEALSVMLQVASFKLTGKRIFKMSPIHHHFEMSGFSENKIVLLFGTVTAILCVAGFFGSVSL